MNRLILIAMLPVVFTACSSNVKKTLGLERNAPDEFAVMERAPLTMPPNFNLMPPTPGAKNPQEALQAQDAQDLVLGSQSSAPVDPANSAGQAALLSKAGATKSNTAIRQQLATPQAETADDASVSQKLGLSQPQNGKALDAAAEAQRLQKSNIKTPPAVQPVSPVMKSSVYND